MFPSEFFALLQQWKKLDKFPPNASWPDKINWGRDFWDGIEKLYKYTLANNHEYETSIFFVDGEVYTTEPFKGDRSTVRSSHNLQVKYVPAYGGFFDKQIILDGKVVKKFSIKSSKLPKSTQAGYLFNTHSHPPDYLELNSEVKSYGFFSDVDLGSFLASSALVSGLVTDEFWMMAKTDRMISNLSQKHIEILADISNASYQGSKDITSLVQSFSQYTGIVFYRASFNKTLLKLK